MHEYFVSRPTQNICYDWKFLLNPFLVMTQESKRVFKEGKQTNKHRSKCWFRKADFNALYWRRSHHITITPMNPITPLIRKYIRAAADGCTFLNFQPSYKYHIFSGQMIEQQLNTIKGTIYKIKYITIEKMSCMFLQNIGAWGCRSCLTILFLYMRGLGKRRVTNHEATCYDSRRQNLTLGRG